MYPPGTLLQLVPAGGDGEAPRADGAPGRTIGSSSSSTCRRRGTKIVTVATNTVVNRFGGNCASCHAAAAAKFDLVCEHDHGCAPLPVSDDIIRLIQLADPRPKA